MDSLDANMDNICRLCLSDKGRLESIFEDEVLRLIIYDCTSIKIFPKLGFPSSICETCKLKIGEYHQFRELCIQNDEYLRTRHLDLEPEIVIKTEPDMDLVIDDDYDDVNEADLEEWDEEGSNDFDFTHTLEQAEAEVEEEDEEELQIQAAMFLQSRKIRQQPEVSVVEPDILVSTAENGSMTEKPKIQTVAVFKCEFCSKEFSDIGVFERHITNHTEEKIFKCGFCPKTFHFAKNLNTHIEFNHLRGSTKKLAALLEQPKQIVIKVPEAVDKRERKIDVVIKKEVVVPPSSNTACVRTSHQCHICRKTFRETHNLKQHMSTEHGGEKPYKCDICSKSFFNASTLKTHSRIHSDNNPYKCEICTKIFDNARSLELHYRTHTGERPYGCNVCMKKFSCSSNLKRHRKLHDREHSFVRSIVR